MNIGIPEQTHLFHKLFKASASWRRQQWGIRTTRRTPKRTSADTVACNRGACDCADASLRLHNAKSTEICRKHARNIQTWLQSERTPSKQHCEASRIQTSVRVNETTRTSLYVFADFPPPHQCVCNRVIFIQYFRDRQTQIREWNFKRLSVHSLSLSLALPALVISCLTLTLTLALSFFCLSRHSTHFQTVSTGPV